VWVCVASDRWGTQAAGAREATQPATCLWCPSTLQHPRRRLFQKAAAPPPPCPETPTRHTHTHTHLEELCAQLVGEQGDVLQDGQPHAPVLVLRQLLDCGQQGLREQLDADDLVHLRTLGECGVRVCVCGGGGVTVPSACSASASVSA
jgi:hypothetical protein